MSTKQLLGGLARMLQQQSFGTRIKDQNGRLQDTGVDQLAQVLIDYCNSDAPIEMTGPLQLINHGSTAAIVVDNNGGDSRAFEIRLPNGQYGSLGIGQGNVGVVANELRSDPAYWLPDTSTQETGTSIGQRGGQWEQTPGSLPVQVYPFNVFPVSGIGRLPATNVPTDTDGNGARWGSGLPTGYFPAYPTPQIPRPADGIGAATDPTSDGQFRPAVMTDVNGGGGRERHSGPDVGTGRRELSPPFQSPPNFGAVWGSYSPETNGPQFTVGGEVVYWPLVPSDDGFTGTKTIVTAVACSSGSLSITTEDFTFERGLLTGVA